MIVVTIARKPLSESTVASNVLATGTGSLNIDACRIGTGTGGEAPVYVPNKKNAVFGVGMGGGEWDSTKGRWPANLVLEHRPGCVQDGLTFQGSGRFVPPDGVCRTSEMMSPEKGWNANGMSNSVKFAPNSYGVETVPAWHCAPGCPVAELDAVEPVSRFFKQVKS